MRSNMNNSDIAEFRMAIDNLKLRLISKYGIAVQEYWN